MIVTIVTEGQTDAKVISAALGERPDVRVISASGRSAADSSARSVLAATGEPVILVVDADTTDAASIQERRSFHESSLRQIAGASRWSVVVMSPTLEALLFQEPQITRRLFGDLSTEQQVAARYAPRQVAREALRGTSLVEALNRLDATDWQSISNLPDMRRILDSVDQLQRNRAARPSAPQ